MQQVMTSGTVVSASTTQGRATLRWRRLAWLAAAVAALLLGAWFYFGSHGSRQVAWADVIAGVQQAQSARVTGWTRNHTFTADSSGKVISFQLGDTTDMHISVARPNKFRQDSPDGSRSVIWDGQQGLMLDHTTKTAMPITREMLPPGVADGGMDRLILANWNTPPTDQGTPLTNNGEKTIDGRTLLELESRSSNDGGEGNVSYRSLTWVLPDSGDLAGVETQVLIDDVWQAISHLAIELNPSLPSDFFSTQIPQDYRVPG